MSGALTVLVVEDEILLAMDLEAMIEDSGHSVLAEARSLDEVAFVDLQLAKGSNGLDVSKLIRERWPDALIVYITANVSKIPPDFSGAHGFIAKPFSQAGIVSALHYLANGVFDPPPSIPRPASFVPSPHLEQRWPSN